MTTHWHVKKLEAPDADFKSYHFAIMDLVEEQTFGEEQAEVDYYNDKVLFLTDRPASLDRYWGAASPPKHTTK